MSKSAKISSLLFIISLLAACGGGDMQDLRNYVEGVKSREKGEIEPLPEIKPFPQYEYQAFDMRDPFTPDIEAEEIIVPIEGGLSPDPDRVKEELESFPLDSLRMVGTLKRDGQMWAIISTADGTVHTVTLKNYMGQNHGQIIAISEEMIELREIVPNGRGGWEERMTTVALTE